MEIGDGTRRIRLEADDQRSGPVEQQQAERAANEPVHKIADRQPLRGGIAAPRALQERDQRRPEISPEHERKGVVPRLAPSMLANAGTRSTSPPAAKLAAINPVAVLLWRMAVTPIPAAKARKRSPRVRPRKRRRLGPKARWMPLCTMCRPQRSSAIAPARSIRDRVALIFPSLRQPGPRKR